MFHSIRWRIAIPFIILTILTMVGLGVYFSSLIRQIYLTHLETQLIGQSRLMADSLSGSPKAWSDTALMVRTAKNWSDLVQGRVTLVTAEGVVVGDSHEDQAQMENHLNRPEIVQARNSGQGSSTRFSTTVGYQMIYTAVPVTTNEQVQGYVRLALPLQQVQENISRLQGTLTGVTLLSAFLTVLLATIISGRTTRPLRELTDAAGRMARGELAGRLNPTTQDEVGRLTHAFNTMSSQLQLQISALETERSKLAAVLQKMTDGVLIVDELGKVQLINPAAEDMFGIRQDKALGLSLAKALRNHLLIEIWKQCQETGEPQSIPMEISDRGLYIHGVAAPLGRAMEGHTLFVFQNLTRVRWLETVRRDFISNVSHELRTPLASLKALTETLQEGALEDPPAARRFLQRMETEVDALTQLVSELLELSRIESGRVPLKMVATYPKEILVNAVDRLYLQAERAGVTIKLEYEQDLPPILADPTRLEQVVVNLLHNAIKFSPLGGEILLSAKAQYPSVLFLVSDNGAGIPAEDLPRIFERFYKADRARSTGGTGLGLAIARHMVEAHGGRIWVESQEGAGSQFYFTIPLA